MFDALLMDDNTQIIKKIMIGPSEKYEVKSLLGLDTQKAGILNYDDWGYFKLIVNRASFDYLKINLFEN